MFGERLYAKSKYVRNGGFVNSLGELQSEGNAIDALCGTLTGLRRALEIIEEMTNENTE